MTQRTKASPLAQEQRVPQPSSSAKARRGCRLEAHHDSRAFNELDAPSLRRANVPAALNSPSLPLQDGIREQAESQFGFDLRHVRIHANSAGAHSASSLGADAYTSGSHIVLGQEGLSPSSSKGHALLQHELAHVVQQGAPLSHSSAEPVANQHGQASQAENEAERFESGGSSSVAAGVVAPGTIQRKLSMRDVGRGEQSGFARVPELIDRLNVVSTGLVFALKDGELTYSLKKDGKLSNFDTQMQGFIDQAAVLPLRFTNRHGLLGNRTAGFNDRVQVDDYRSGYVDIDDLLASDNLGLQSALVHFLRERTSTSNYVRRIGTESLEGNPDTPEGRVRQAEFDRSHARGIQAELDVLRGFFNDSSIRLITGADSGDVFRVFRNSRGDTIRTRVREGRGANTGVDAVTVEVVTRDGKIHTPEEYKSILAAAGSSPAATPSTATAGSGGGRP